MFQTICHRIAKIYLVELGVRPAARVLSHSIGLQRILQLSFVAICFTCFAAADGNRVTVKQLYQTHASLLAGDVVFSNFQVPPQVPYGYPGGANSGDGSDLAVSTISLSNGGIGLVFTPIGGEDGGPKPYYVSSSGGSSGSDDLVRNVTFDVAVSGGRLLHSVGLRHGSASNWNSDSTISNILYYLQPGTGAAGLLLTDTPYSGQGSAVLPGGDTAGLRFADELEMSSSHSHRGDGGSATVDWYEIDFTLMAAGSPAPAPAMIVPDFVGANPIVGGSTGSGLVRLTSAATIGGAAVHLTSANPGVLSVPETVVIPQGALSAVFAITTATVAASTSVNLTASLNGTSANGSVQLIAAPGTSTPAPSSGPPASPASLRFVPVSPCRVVDTRNVAGPYGGPVMKDLESREFDIPGGQCNVPTNALAYSMNITVVPSGPLGYLTLWPTGQATPTVSTLNSDDGRVKANAAIVPAGVNGAVSVYVTNQSHVVIDINGYFVAASNITALAYYPLSPCRVLDTRNATGSSGGPYLSGGRERELLVTSSPCHIPSDAQAYSMNVTSIPHSPLSYLTVWPSGQQRPGVSTLNAPTGEITANAALIPAGQGGDISVFATQDTDLVLDVNGYYAPPAPGGLSLYPVAPCRIFDSRSGRDGSGHDSDTEIEGESQILLSGSCGIPPSAQAVVMNATVIPASSLQYMTLWPNDHEARPEVSTLNAPDGSITSNMAVVPTSSGGVRVFTAGPSHLVLDVSTYYAP